MVHLRLWLPRSASFRFLVFFASDSSSWKSVHIFLGSACLFGSGAGKSRDHGFVARSKREENKYRVKNMN
jgi:hypothetical protein